jgi:hypothetical protein
VALLYVWLAGHWFGRVLMFLLLGAIVFVAVAANAGPFVGLLGVVPAWFVASIPIYCRRHNAQETGGGLMRDYRATRDAVRAMQMLHPTWTLQQCIQQAAMYHR